MSVSSFHDLSPRGARIDARTRAMSEIDLLLRARAGGISVFDSARIRLFIGACWTALAVTMHAPAHAHEEAGSSLPSVREEVAGGTI